MNKQELRTFYSRAQDPRRFWITVYRSDKGPVFTGHNRLHSDHFAGLPFVSRSDTDAPAIRIDAWRRRTYVLLIDTTSARSWLTSSAFQSLNGTPLGPPAYRFPARHVENEAPGYVGVVSKIRFDRLHMEDALFCARGAIGPIGGLARGIEKPKVDGVLGFDMIQSFRYMQLNYQKRTAVFSATTEYQPDEQFLMASLPYHEVAGALAVYGKVNGRETAVLLDTAGDFIFVSEEEAFTDVRQLELGNLVFRNVETTSPHDYDLGLSPYPRIGRRLLRRFKVTIDSQAKVVHFERPDTVRR